MKFAASKRNKYGVASKVARTFDGIVFASAAEARRYRELLLLQRAGRISNLRLQPEFLLLDPFHYRGRLERAIKYRADFAYDEGGFEVVEDVKGVRTPVFQLKRKLLLSRYPSIDFREVS